MEKATKGKWKILDTDDTFDTKVRIVVSETEACGVEVTTCCGEREDALADAEFIVEMENSAPELLRLAEIGERVEGETKCRRLRKERYENS